MSDPIPKDDIIVAAPFDADSPGDCYLQSADGHNFKVYKNILGLASPVFRDMFTLPQPTDSTPSDTDLPIVPMSEDADTIHRVLLLLYPPGELDPPTIDVDQFVNLVAAHDKYDIPRSALRRITSDFFQSQKDLLSRGMEMFAAAWRLKLETEAKITSRYTHTVDLEDPAVARDLILRSGSIDALLSLIKLRRSREEALDKVISALSLRAYLCDAHGGNRHHGSEGDAAYWVQVAGLKEKIKVAIGVPYPKCTDVFQFLGITPGTSAGPIGAVGRCSGSSCFGGSRAGITATLATAIGNYPQEIPGFESIM